MLFSLDTANANQITATLSWTLALQTQFWSMPLYSMTRVTCQETLENFLGSRPSLPRGRHDRDRLRRRQPCWWLARRAIAGGRRAYDRRRFPAPQERGSFAARLVDAV